MEESAHLRYSCEKLRDIKIPTSDRVIRGNVELQIISGSESNGPRAVFRFKNKFLDKRGNAAVAGHAEPECFLFPCPHAPSANDVDMNSSLPLLDRIGPKTPRAP